MTVQSPNQPPPAFSFDGYTLRPTAESDRPYLEKLIAEDQYHFDRMTADFFLKLKPGEDSWALEDEAGEVVFYFKTSTAVRLAIQFTDSSSLAAKRRNGAALIHGLAWLTGVLQRNRFREIFFDTDGPELHVFAKRHLGFADATGLLSLALPTFPTTEAQPEALGTVPTNRLEGTG